MEKQWKKGSKYVNLLFSYEPYHELLILKISGKYLQPLKKILQKMYLKMLLHSGHFCDEKNDPQFSKVSCLKIWVFICYSCAVSLTVRRLCRHTLQTLAYLFIFHTVHFILKIIPRKIQKKKNIEVCGNIGF